MSLDSSNQRVKGRGKEEDDVSPTGFPQVPSLSDQGFSLSSYLQPPVFFALTQVVSLLVQVI